MNVCGVTFGGYLAKLLSFKSGNLLYKSNFYVLSEPTVSFPLFHYLADLDISPQCTEEDHDDKQDLIKAKVLMSDVAASINESKRRKDIVDKYRSEETDKTLTRKIAKFSMHSLNKKSNRYVHFTLSLHT